MAPIKVHSVFGTRPEAIKMAPLVREMRAHPDRIISRVCVTGQHREMLDQVLGLFGIVPDYDLDVLQDAGTPTRVAAAILARLEPILQAEKPDWVLVQGDTTTVAAAAIAGFYNGARVAHVEAGLRTFDKYQPFPEEINRRMATALTEAHFAPTTRARENLLAEGIPAEDIVLTGNPVIDALHWVTELPYDPSTGPLTGIPWDRRILLLTAHRRENQGAPLERICDAVRFIADQYAGDVHIAFPVHLNPRVRETVYARLDSVANITLLPPLDYLPLAYLMQRCYLVLTDSGGLQEEAPALGKPVLVLRDTTERPEAVEAGTARLIGTAVERIVAETTWLLNDRGRYERMARAANPYGDGQAARRIVTALLGWEGRKAAAADLARHLALRHTAPYRAAVASSPTDAYARAIANQETLPLGFRLDSAEIRAFMAGRGAGEAAAAAR